MKYIFDLANFFYLLVRGRLEDTSQWIEFMVLANTYNVLRIDDALAANLYTPCRRYTYPQLQKENFSFFSGLIVINEAFLYIIVNLN